MNFKITDLHLQTVSHVKSFMHNSKEHIWNKKAPKWTYAFPLEFN